MYRQPRGLGYKAHLLFLLPGVKQLLVMFFLVLTFQKLIHSLYTFLGGMELQLGISSQSRPRLNMLNRAR